MGRKRILLISRRVTCEKLRGTCLQPFPPSTVTVPTTAPWQASTPRIGNWLFMGLRSAEWKGVHQRGAWTILCLWAEKGLAEGKYKSCVSIGFKPTQLSACYCFLPPGLYCPLTQLSFYDVPPPHVTHRYPQLSCLPGGPPGPSLGLEFLSGSDFIRVCIVGRCILPLLKQSDYKSTSLQTITLGAERLFYSYSSPSRQSDAWPRAGFR